MEVVMRTLPSDQGGIADSLAILTRSVGIVGGATLLMLAFDIAKVEASGPDAFLSAFRATYRLAGLVSAASGALAVLGRPPASKQ